MRTASVDIAAAIQRLAQRGAKITYAAVRAEAGGGSNSTIQEEIRKHRGISRNKERGSMPPEALINASEAIVTLAWNTALDEARNAWEQERSRLLSQIAELQEEIACLKNRQAH